MENVYIMFLFLLNFQLTRKIWYSGGWGIDVLPHAHEENLLLCSCFRTFVCPKDADVFAFFLFHTMQDGHFPSVSVEAKGLLIFF